MRIHTDNVNWTRALVVLLVLFAIGIATGVIGCQVQVQPQYSNTCYIDETYEEVCQ